MEYKNQSIDVKEKRNRNRLLQIILQLFFKIANHLSYRPNFINYTFRDDMISDDRELFTIISITLT